MKAKSKYLLWVAIGIGGLLWAVYVWPTPWNHYKQGSNNLRVNRFTGKTQVLRLNGWTQTDKFGGVPIDKPEGFIPDEPKPSQ